LISSTVNPSGANLSKPNSLVAAPSLAIPCAPCVVLPNNAASVSALPPTSLAKSSNGNAADAAAILRSTILFPKLPPTIESCLNVSRFVSNTLPMVCRPKMLSVKSLKAPVPLYAALPNPTKDSPTFLVTFLKSSWAVINFSVLLTCSSICLYSLVPILNWFLACSKSLCFCFNDSSSILLMFLANLRSLALSSAAFLLPVDAPPVVPLSAIACKSLIICSNVAIRLYFAPFYTHINIDTYTQLVYIYRIKKW